MIYSSWYIEQNILKLINLGHFLPFYPPKKTPKSKFWKMKITIYDVQFLRHGVRQTEFFVIMGHFLLFYHPSSPHLPNDLENQNFEIKKKKITEDIIFLYIHVYHK